MEMNCGFKIPPGCEEHILIDIMVQTVKEKIKRFRKFFQGVCERCDTAIDPCTLFSRLLRIEIG